MRQYKRQDNTFPPARWWRRWRGWVAGLDRREKLCYRLSVTAVIMLCAALLLRLILGAWLRLPELPGLPSGGGQGGTTQFEGAEIPDIALSGRREGTYTFLLAGVDVASGATDTVMLITFDTKAKTVDALSLPRDTMVNVSTRSKRLNAVYSSNKGKDKATQVEKGMAALKKQVGKLTGVPPDFYVLVEWDAVGELVDALGGVTFNVPFDMDYDDPYQDLHIHQKAGERKLTGEDAMQVIRWRKNNTGASQGDVARIAIQQDFLKAVAKQCLTPAVLLKAPALAQVFADNVTTDLTVGNLLAFAQLANGMDADSGLTMNTMPYTPTNYGGAAMVLPVEDELLVLLNSGINPYLRDLRADDLELLYQKSNGSYGVTNGTLADERLAAIPAPPEPEEPEQPEEPETPIEPEEPDAPDAPVEPEGPQEPSEPEDDPTLDDLLDPDKIFPPQPEVPEDETAPDAVPYV